jgi:hypothetical protein
MNPAELKAKLAAAFPAYKWTVEPIANQPTVTATTGNRHIKVVQNDNAFYVEVRNADDDFKQCNWIDPRPWDRLLPSLSSHLEWFAPVEPPTPTARPKRTR